MKIPLSAPDITEVEKKYVSKVMDGILSIGPMIERFERLVADFAGVKYTVAVNSGTSALHLILRSLGLHGGDKVITTPFSFIASSNAILFEQAVPVFTDIDITTYNMNTDEIEPLIDEKTKGVLPVDAFGFPVDIVRINKIAKNHGLFVVEDSCEAMGSSINGRKCGSDADAGAYAFYPNKQITTAEGGIILTNDEDLYLLSRSMRNQGRSVSNTWLSHERLGFNYRLSELHAALGVGQMERIDEILKKRHKVACVYFDKLQYIKGVVLPPEGDSSINNGWFVYVIRLDDYQEEALNLIQDEKTACKDKSGRYQWPDSGKCKEFLEICDKVNGKRNELIEHLLKNGVECRAYFSPIHLQPFYRDIFHYVRGDYPVTEYVSSGTIALPFFSNLEIAQIEYISNVIEIFLSKNS